MPKIYFSTVTPPPFTGMTFVSQCVLSILRKHKKEIIDFSVSKNPIDSKFTWSLRKLLASLTIPVECPQILYQGGIIYTVPNSHHGLWFSLIQTLYLKLFGLRIFFHHHVSSYCRNWHPAMKLIQLCLAEEDTNIFLSDSMRSDFRVQYSGNAFSTVVENHLITPFLHAKLSSQKDVHGRIKIGFLSNLTLDKGVADFLELARALPSKVFEFHLAGPCDEETAEILNRCSLANLYYSGPVFGDAKATFFHNCDYFYFPSKYSNEASPLVVIEALHYDCAVIAYKIGYIQDICNDGEIQLFDSFDDVLMFFNSLKTSSEFRYSLKDGQKSEPPISARTIQSIDNLLSIFEND